MAQQVKEPTTKPDHLLQSLDLQGRREPTLTLTLTHMPPYSQSRIPESVILCVAAPRRAPEVEHVVQSEHRVSQEDMKMAGTYHTQRKTGPSLFMVPKFSHRKDLRWLQEEPCRLTSNVANQAGPVPASSFPFTYKPG